MKRFLSTLILLGLGAHTAAAYEFKLHFAPPSGALGVTVAGYQFKTGTGSTVVAGNCSYYTISGQGGHFTIIQHYNVCTWDLYGNQISLTPVTTAPVAPPRISTIGTEIVYAISGTSKTGHDTRGFGFVNTPSSHYSWEPISIGYATIPYAVHKFTLTLISDGDFPLDYDGATVTTSVTGLLTPSGGTATVSATTCGDSVAAGSTCSVTVTYNPTTIKCVTDNYGYAYTTMDLKLITDAGANTDFTQKITITSVPVCNE